MVFLYVKVSLISCSFLDFLMHIAHGTVHTLLASTARFAYSHTLQIGARGSFQLAIAWQVIR